MRNNKNEFDRQILSDIKTMDADELMKIHGISINEETKEVYDQTYDKTFSDINEWIYFSSEDQESEFEKFGVDDEYYDDY